MTRPSDLTTLASAISRAFTGSGDGVVEWGGGYSALVASIVSAGTQFPQRPANRVVTLDEPRRYKTAVLTSGGFDSTIAWLRTTPTDDRDRVALYADIGEAYSGRERAALEFWGIKPIELGYLKTDERWDHIVPGRNLSLILLAAEYVAHEGELWLGVVSGESNADSGDKALAVLVMLTQLIWRLSNRWITIRTFENETKNDLLEWYLGRYHDHRILTDTVSCFGPVARCGECQACARRWIAMNHCSMGTSGHFAQPVETAGLHHLKGYLSKFAQAIQNQDFSHYSKRRCEQDLAAIKKGLRL